MSIKPGLTITCPTRLLRPDLLDDDGQKTSANQQQTCVIVRKSDPPARSWIVRWNHDSKETVLTTLAITKCLKAETQNNIENVMEIDTEIHPQPLPVQENTEARVLDQNNPILLLRQLHAQISDQLRQYRFATETSFESQSRDSKSIVDDVNNNANCNP